METPEAPLSFPTTAASRWALIRGNLSHISRNIPSTPPRKFQTAAATIEVTSPMFASSSVESSQVPTTVNTSNYALTVRHGFQFRARLACKHALVVAVAHEKAPRHRDEGHWEDGIDDTFATMGDAMQKTKRDSAVELDASSKFRENSRIKSTDTLKSEKKPTKMKLYTFVAVEHNKSVRLWDSSTKMRPEPKPRLIAKVNRTCQKIAYIPRYSIYATCAEEKEIRFFSPRFELLQSHKSSQHIQFLVYNDRLNQLIAVSSHVIMIWGLKAAVHRGRLNIDLSLRHATEISLPTKEWITNVFLDAFSQYLYVMVNSKVLIYECSTCMEVDSWLQVSSRQVTSIVCYHPYSFTILGCKDGTIKVLNMSSALVHEFQSHYRPITSLALYPHSAGGPVVIATALDKTIRMYSLKTFKEVYCLRLVENPVALTVLDDATMCITSSESVTLWNLNHINSGFCTLNSHAIKIARVDSLGGIPTRILTRTEDDVIRLVSPINGKVLTTCLPLFEMDKVVEVAYSAKIDKMFLLIETGEIWTIGTTHNPCVVLDIWRSIGEEISVLVVVEGSQLLDGSNSMTRQKNVVGSHSAGVSLSFAVLMSGTTNGQILLYNLVGDVVYRQQLHLGKVTCIVSDIEHNIIVSGGEDKLIRVSRFSPMSPDIFDVLVSIEAEAVPRIISIGSNYICVCYDDATLHMYQFNLGTGTSRLVPNHSKSDDHTETITSICSAKALGLFITASMDSTVKVWDLHNNMVREIQFHHPILSVALASQRGDLLLDIDNRIDIIAYNLYLPPPYIKLVEASSRQEESNSEFEDPIQFADDFNFKQNFASAHVPISADELNLGLSGLETRKKLEPSQLFAQMNFAVDAGMEVAIKTKLRLSAQKRRELLKEGERVYEELMQKLAVVMERRRRIVESAKRRLDLENLEIEKRELVLHEEFEKHQKHQQLMEVEPTYLKKTRWQIESFNALVPASDTQGDTGTAIDSMEVLKKFQFFEEESIGISDKPRSMTADLIEEQGGDKFQVLENAKDTLPDSVLEELIPGTPPDPEEEYEDFEGYGEDSNEAIVDPVTEATKENAKAEKRHEAKKTELHFAPDGLLPNSILNTKILEWKNEHPAFKVQSFLDAVQMAVRKRQASMAVEQLDAAKEAAKKAAFKNKIQDMLKKKQEEERIEAEKAEAAAKAALDNGEGLVEKETLEGSRSVSHARPRPAPTKTIAPLQKVKVVEKYPRILAEGMKFSWFPMDDVFYPLIEKVNLYIKKDKKKEEDLRKLKIEPNSESMMPIILETFKKQTAAGIKLQIFQYMTWIFEEFGCRDTTTLLRFFCRYLQTNPYVDLEPEELMFRELVIKYLPKFGLSQIELMPTLIIQLMSPIESLQSSAVQTLLSCGLFDDYHHRLQLKIKELFSPNEATLQAEAVAIRESKIQTPRKQQLLLAVNEPTRLSPLRRSNSINTGILSVNSQGSTIQSQAPPTNVPSLQSPAVLEVRNNIMVWLRKTLRRYLIRTGV
ncbi:hypothetical protein BC830DRAFT_221057 [Chytriomyces sp. MP71]|nr:hypothetical protein BC830DRAFT_221057 [Chytriomyces sp. MP71]